MKDKITQNDFENLIDEFCVGYGKSLPQKIYELHQQSLQQILEEAGEELPDDEIVNQVFPVKGAFGIADGKREAAKWMRSEASKVVAKLKEQMREINIERAEARQAVTGLIKQVEQQAGEIQQLKEELARKEEPCNHRSTYTTVDDFIKCKKCGKTLDHA